MQIRSTILPYLAVAAAVGFTAFSYAVFYLWLSGYLVPAHG